METESINIQTSGTLGDCYLTALKLLSFPHPVSLYHFVRGEHNYWAHKLISILTLPDNVRKISFVEKEDENLPKVDSRFRHKTSQGYELIKDPLGIVPSWFPGSSFLAETHPFMKKDHHFEEDNYVVVQVNSGKPVGKGNNTKAFPKADLMNLLTAIGQGLIIEGVEYKTKLILLIGTDLRYEALRPDGACNLVGQTNLLEAMRLVSRACAFIGPEGLMAWVARSYKRPARIFYASEEALQVRLFGTPWEDCAPLEVVKNNDFIRW
jgi:ADP-heptose:LPS heptosyltransferase